MERIRGSRPKAANGHENYMSQVLLACSTEEKAHNAAWIKDRFRFMERICGAGEPLMEPEEAE